MWKPEECFCMRLKRASEELLKLYTKTIAPAGVTPVQYLILLRIHELQSGSLREIADAIGVDRSTLARTIRPLEKNGLVKDNKPVGARNGVLVLTPEGETVFRNAQALWNEAQDIVAARLGKEGVDTYSDFLKTVTDG